MSHPVWVCGLKPFNDDWAVPLEPSHPVWVCGLKLISSFAWVYKPKSHPVWVCGLKLVGREVMDLVHRHTLYGCVD